MYCTALVSLRYGRKDARIITLRCDLSANDLRTIGAHATRRCLPYLPPRHTCHTVRVYTRHALHTDLDPACRRFDSRRAERNCLREFSESLRCLVSQRTGLISRFKALDSRRAHTPRARFFGPSLSFFLSPTLPPPSSLCVATRAGGKNAWVTFIHPTGRSTT